MSFAYNPTDLYNLAVTKECKRWFKQGLIATEQYDKIKAEYPSRLFHPNFIIRILLIVATLIALLGITGILGLMFADSGESVLSSLMIMYGVGSFVVLDRFFIGQKNHYKSGVTEALMYHSGFFTLMGLAILSDFHFYFILVSCLLVFSFAAWRYLDLLCTLGAVGVLTALVFYLLYDADGILRQLIPFGIIALFAPVYFVVKGMKRNPPFKFWNDNLTIVEGASLLLIYVAGNYFVVRKLSESMMGLYLEDGQDIPFALLFYALTGLIPVVYLYFGIRRRDIVLLRVSLLAIAFSVFTFKYYFSLGHPEITLTISGLILTGISLWLMQYLKVIRHGFTRENHLPEKWADMNVEALIISQTLGGNQITENPVEGGGGGDFSGGGASTQY